MQELKFLYEKTTSADSSYQVAEDIETVIDHEDTILTAESGKGTVKVWDKQLKFKTQIEAHEWPIYHMVSDGKLFYTAANDGSIKQWQNEGNDYKCLKTMTGHKEAIRKLRISGKRLYSGDEKGDIYIWENGESIGHTNMVEEIFDLAVDGDMIYTIRDRDLTISQFNKKGESTKCSTVNTISGSNLILLYDNKLIFPDRSGLNILIHDAKVSGNPKLGCLKKHEGMVNCFAALKNILYSAGWDKKIIGFDLNSMTVVSETPLKGYASAMAIVNNDKDKCIIVVGGESELLCAFEA